MEDLGEKVLWIVKTMPGLTDREITDHLLGKKARVQAVNRAAHLLCEQHILERCCRQDGKIGNYLAGVKPRESSEGGTETLREKAKGQVVQMSEGEVKRRVKAWLQDAGWVVSVRDGPGGGADIVAEREGLQWVIEAKGSGSRNEMRSNHFLSALGEVLQHMEDPMARYSIALPDMKKFRALWSRFPALGKSRTRISVLFVGLEGEVEEGK